jgi:hypothetical protein
MEKLSNGSFEEKLNLFTEPMSGDVDFYHQRKASMQMKKLSRARGGREDFSNLQKALAKLSRSRLSSSIFLPKKSFAHTYLPRNASDTYDSPPTQRKIFRCYTSTTILPDVPKIQSFFET